MKAGRKKSAFSETARKVGAWKRASRGCDCGKVVQIQDLRVGRLNLGKGIAAAAAVLLFDEKAE